MRLILDALDKLFQLKKTPSDKASVWITDFDAVTITRDVLILDSQRTRFTLNVSPSFAWAVAPLLSIYSKQSIDLTDADEYVDPAENAEDFTEWCVQVFRLRDPSRTVIELDTSRIDQRDVTLMDNILVLETDRAKIQICLDQKRARDIATALAGYYHIPASHLLS